MPFRKGSWILQWGGNELTDIEEIETNIEQESEDRNTLGGTTYTFDGAIRASVTITLLRSDLPALATVLPQYFVPNGGVLSTGETVNHAAGAIDIKAASCDTNPVYGPLDIISCGNPGQVMRLVNARTKIDSVEFNEFLGVVRVQFIGEPAPGDANLQFFYENSVAVVS